MEPWSADGFRRGISADNPFGVHEYRNVIGNRETIKKLRWGKSMSEERDLLKELVVSTYEDVKSSHETLQNNDSQYNRRTFIRTAFAAVEASSYLLKQHCIKENNGIFQQQS